MITKSNFLKFFLNDYAPMRLLSFFKKQLLLGKLIPLLLFGILIQEVSGQVTFDTIYQTDRRTSFSINFLRASNDYIAWYEGELINNEIKRTIYRMHQGNLESQSPTQNYSVCNSVNGLYLYNDFVYFRLGDDNLAFCDQGFIWGQDSLIQDSFNIGDVCVQHNNLFLSSSPESQTLIDMNTNTRKVLNLENNDYRYRGATNTCTLNDSLLYLNLSKYDKNDNTFIGGAIIQYNWKTDELKEIFSSNEHLTFNSESKEGTLAFIETKNTSPSINNLYYYDGNQVLLIAQRNITNTFAYSYMNGVVYTSNDSLFYWKDNITVLLNNDVHRVWVDNCKLSWISFTNKKIHFYNGSVFEEGDFTGFINEFSYSLFSDTSFIFVDTDQNLTKHYIIKGNYNLTCSENCNYPDINIPEEDGRTYLKAKNINSQASIDDGNTMYKATESINLLPGFSVAANMEFLAKIENCNAQSLKTIAATNRPLLEKETEKVEVLPRPKSTKSTKLAQNRPNPFKNGTTVIPYFVQEGSQNASIKVFNSWGQLIKDFKLEHFGTGNIEVKMDEFAKGMFYYSLEVDGRVVDVKKMISIR